MSTNYEKALVSKYEGGNIHLERVMFIYPPDGEVWIVNSSNGRQPVIVPAGSVAKDALERYKLINSQV